MVCTHLKELHQLCASNQLVISSSDLIRITCRQCDEVETCPSVMMAEYDAIESSATSDTRADEHENLSVD